MKRLILAVLLSAIPASTLLAQTEQQSGCPFSQGLQICSFFADLEGLKEFDGSDAYHFLQLDAIALAPANHYWVWGSVYTPNAVWQAQNPGQRGGYFTLVSGACRDDSDPLILRCEFSGRGNLFQATFHKVPRSWQSPTISWHRLGTLTDWIIGSACYVEYCD